MKRTLIAGLFAALLLTGCGGADATPTETGAAAATEAVVFKSPT